MVKLCCCLVQIRWWYNMTSFICYKSHHTSHFSNLWVFPIAHSDQIKPCIEHAGFLSSYILTNSIFQYTHYGMWTFKWMQQFHLKVTSRYYNGTLSLFYLDVCFLQINTLFFFFTAHKIQTKGHSLYVCDASAGEKNMRRLRRKAPSVRLLRELYSEEFKRSACHWPEGFCKLWAVCLLQMEIFWIVSSPIIFGAQDFSALKTGEHMYSCTDTQLQAYVRTYRSTHAHIDCAVLRWDV